MTKSTLILFAATMLSLSACSKEEEIPVEPVIEDVETSEEDALADAIENAESAADSMGKELSDATAPEVSAAPIADEVVDAEE